MKTQNWGEELSEDQRIYNNTPTHNKLSEAIRQEILIVINQRNRQQLLVEIPP